MIIAFKVQGSKVQGSKVQSSKVQSSKFKSSKVQGLKVVVSRNLFSVYTSRFTSLKQFKI